MRVKFYGGPRDGEVMDFAHGDIVQFPVYERGPINCDFGAKNEPVEFKTALYRRSLRDPNVFVYQP